MAMENKDQNVPDDENQIPFLEKYMVPSRYELFRFGGGTIRDEERGIRRMLQYFSDSLLKNSSEQIWSDITCKNV